MSKKLAITNLAIIVGLTGCATASKNIAPMSVSPLQYSTYDCSQLAAEFARVSVRVQQLGGRLDEAASNDAAITGVGLVLFWPALFFLGGTKQQEAEYARLKGEHEALQQSAIEKKCPALVAPPPPAPTTPTDTSTQTTQNTPIAPTAPTATTSRCADLFTRDIRGQLATGC